MSNKPSKRRSRKAADKLRIVLEGLEGGVEISDLCRREGIHPTQYYQWKKRLLDSAEQVFNTSASGPSREQQRTQEELSRAKDVIAEITAENLELKKRSRVRGSWEASRGTSTPSSRPCGRNQDTERLADSS